jgi:hypothetical protein
MGFYKKDQDDDLKYIMNSRKVKKNPKSKYIRSSNLRSKSYSTMCFWPSLLTISFEILNFIFYIQVFSTTLKFIMEKKINLKNTTFRPLTQKNMVLVHRSTILVHFTMLAPQGN